ncbi:hypothetical protein [Bacillus cereus]|uniref:hypothetical protein n=1 Tax=Bacillus cereus TaxID=1396 RepID=UPI0020C590BD|nr:hypothetical protein [Bacillus cereus]
MRIDPQPYINARKGNAAIALIEMFPSKYSATNGDKKKSPIAEAIRSRFVKGLIDTELKFIFILSSPFISLL